MQKFSKTMRITQENISRVPGDKPGVYRIKNAENDILYVGKAKGRRLDERIAEHKGEFAGGTRFQYRTAPSKEAAERLERREINRNNPPSNRD